ncbi:hypothetical protein SSS_06284 [Sarcoptes scabiei]|nr:hypothetical protein SSS_06284 [Sarcoptes scabiei]
MKNELTNGDSLQPIRVEDEIVINGDEDDEDDSIMDVKAAIVSSTNGLIKRRKSLPPPLKQNISWSEYINAPKGNPPCLGRPWKTKDSNRTFKATIAMVRTILLFFYLRKTHLFLISNLFLIRVKIFH